MYVFHHHTFGTQSDGKISIERFCRILFSVGYSLVVEEAVNRTASHSMYKYIYLVMQIHLDDVIWYDYSLHQTIANQSD